MKSKRNQNIILGVMCVALTAGIFIQINTIENTGMSWTQSQTENELKDQVLSQKEAYENLYDELEEAQLKLEEVRTLATEDNTELQMAEEEIKEAEKILGYAEVTGPGVIVTLTDGTVNENITNPTDVIVHDLDVLSVINELKNAGAEAISINGERLITTSSIDCAGNVIEINGEKIGAPFVIEAIGLSEQLAGIARAGGCLKNIESYGVGVEFEKVNEITIKKYTSNIEFDYVTTIN